MSVVLIKNDDDDDDDDDGLEMLSFSYCSSYTHMYRTAGVEPLLTQAVEAAGTTTDRLTPLTALWHG